MSGFRLLSPGMRLEGDRTYRRLVLLEPDVAVGEDVVAAADIWNEDT